MLLETIHIPIKSIQSNTGQIPGVPANPRLIRDGKFRKLMQSIKDDPEMMALRELIVYPMNKQFIVIGGNMRLKACIELGYKEVPCKVLHPKVTPAQLRAIIMKDNIGYGETDWDMLANGEWDVADLTHWGMDIPDDWGKGEEMEDKPTSTGIPVVKLEILFDDLDYYDHAKKRIMEVIKDYPGVSIKNDKKA